jgi:hypothetical protein
MASHFRRGQIWLAPLFIALGGAPAAAEWHFPIPTGWVDLSPGKPAPPNVPENAVAAAHLYHTYAIDLAGASNGYAENFSVQVLPRATVADEASLREFLVAAAEITHRDMPTAHLSVVEQGIVEIQGVPSLRVVADLTVPHLELRLLQYLIPGGETTAWVTYSATPSAFPRYLPVFEANAHAAQGAGTAPLRTKMGHWVRGSFLGDLSPEDRKSVFGAVGWVVGLSVAILLYRLTRRRKEIPNP